MACRKCGGGKPRVVIQGTSPTASSASLLGGSAEMLTVEYVGPSTQFQKVTSKTNPRVKYRYGGEKGSPKRKFNVLSADVEQFTGNINFQLVRDEAVKSVKAQETILKAEKPRNPVIAVSRVGLVDELALDDATITILKDNGYTTIQSLDTSPDTELLSIKHIGKKRVDAIRTAIREFA